MTVFCLASCQAKSKIELNISTFNFVCVCLCGSVANMLTLIYFVSQRYPQSTAPGDANSALLIVFGQCRHKCTEPDPLTTRPHRQPPPEQIHYFYRKGTDPSDHTEPQNKIHPAPGAMNMYRWSAVACGFPGVLTNNQPADKLEFCTNVLSV